jgi:hypothetical protein
MVNFPKFKLKILFFTAMSTWDYKYTSGLYQAVIEGCIVQLIFDDKSLTVKKGSISLAKANINAGMASHLDQILSHGSYCDTLLDILKRKEYQQIVRDLMPHQSMN